MTWKNLGRLLLGAALIPLVTAVAACGNATNTSAGPVPGVASVGSSASGSASSATPAPGSPAAGGAGSAGSGSGGSGNRCHTGDLAVTQQTAPGGGAAGSYGELLVFRNTSSRSCTMFGYPGVSFVGGGSGQQVNDPFRRDMGTPVAVTVTVRVRGPVGGGEHGRQQRAPGCAAVRDRQPERPRRRTARGRRGRHVAPDPHDRRRNAGELHVRRRRGGRRGRGRHHVLV